MNMFIYACYTIHRYTYFLHITSMFGFYVPKILRIIKISNGTYNQIVTSSTLKSYCEIMLLRINYTYLKMLYYYASINSTKQFYVSRIPER